MKCVARDGSQTKHALEDLDYSCVDEGVIHCRACKHAYELTAKGWVQQS